MNEIARKALYIFAPGWSYGPELWNGLDRYFRPEACLKLDLRLPDKDICSHLAFFIAQAGDLPVVGVGHSLGFLWLLSNVSDYITHWVSINGFGCFCSRDDFPEGIPGRQLARMKKRFSTHPYDVVRDFRIRINDSLPDKIPTYTDQALTGLTEGLNMLESSDMRSRLKDFAHRLTRIEGQHDPMLSLSMQQASFCGLGDVYTIMAGGHVLPLSHAQKCADIIMAASDENV